MRWRDSGYGRGMSPTSLLPALLLACTAGSPQADDTGSAPPPGVEVVTLSTRDEVALVGDLYAGPADAPAVLLLHMTPSGGWNRTDWPGDFLQLLVDRGWWVLALDRRGAGESGGVAQDAYEGDAGRYDVEAAALLLRERGAGELAVIGASNGTTSMIDYAAWAGGEGLPVPVALGFMTGGAYTENQTAMESVPPVPAVYTYSTAERAWSVDQQALDPGSWSFLEYADGDHGTKMFDAAPEVRTDLEDFLAAVL